MHAYPLLQRVFELYEEAGLGNVLLLSCQHLMQPQKRMFEHLIQLGLKPENCVIVGKNYSTNAEVLEELRATGCVVASFSNEFDPLQPFDTWFEEKLTAFVAEEISERQMEKYSRVIVLDDGGFMHLVVDRLCPNLTNVVGIEQTSSGHHKIQAANIRFPNISVARSYHKLMFESPYIGRNGHERIMRHLRMSGKNDPNILVIGLGHIGRQTAGQLFVRENFRGIAVDPNIDELRYGHRPGIKGIFDLMPKRLLKPSGTTQSLEEFDFVIGTTGSPTLADSDIEKLHPSASLISMSSSDREFPALHFRQSGGTLHQDYMMNGRTLVNAGFPITFDGARDAMPPQQIELTISLLFIRLMDEASGHLQHLPSVVGQIHAMWQPDEGADAWYEAFNRGLS